MLIWGIVVALTGLGLLRVRLPRWLTIIIRA